MASTPPCQGRRTDKQVANCFEFNIVAYVRASCRTHSGTRATQARPGVSSSRLLRHRDTAPGNSSGYGVLDIFSPIHWAPWPTTRTAHAVSDSALTRFCNLRLQHLRMGCCVSSSSGAAYRTEGRSRRGVPPWCISITILGTGQASH